MKKFILLIALLPLLLNSYAQTRDTLAQPTYMYDNSFVQFGGQSSEKPAFILYAGEGTYTGHVDNNPTLPDSLTLLGHPRATLVGSGTWCAMQFKEDKGWAINYPVRVVGLEDVKISFWVKRGALMANEGNDFKIWLSYDYNSATEIVEDADFKAEKWTDITNNAEIISLGKENAAFTANTTGGFEEYITASEWTLVTLNLGVCPAPYVTVSFTYEGAIPVEVIDGETKTQANELWYVADFVASAVRSAPLASIDTFYFDSDNDPRITPVFTGESQGNLGDPWKRGNAKDSWDHLVGYEGAYRYRINNLLGTDVNQVIPVDAHLVIGPFDFSQFDEAGFSFWSLEEYGKTLAEATMTFEVSTDYVPAEDSVAAVAAATWVDYNMLANFDDGVSGNGWTFSQFKTPALVGQSNVYIDFHFVAKAVAEGAAATYRSGHRDILGLTVDGIKRALTTGIETQTYDFGVSAIGEASTSVLFPLTNNRDASVTIAASDVILPTGFVLSADFPTDGLMIAARDTQNIAIQFSPLAFEAYEGNLAIAVEGKEVEIATLKGSGAKGYDFMVTTNGSTPLEGAEVTIYVKDDFSSTVVFGFTDANGKVSLAIGEEGTYTFYVGKPAVYGTDLATDNFTVATSALGKEEYTINMSDLSVSATAINDVASIDFTFYPNPVKEVLTLNLKSNISVLEVISLSGNVIYQQRSITESTVEINLENQVNGVYLLKLTDNNGITDVVKFIKD